MPDIIGDGVSEQFEIMTAICETKGAAFDGTDCVGDLDDSTVHVSLSVIVVFVVVALVAVSLVFVLVLVDAIFPVRLVLVPVLVHDSVQLFSVLYFLVLVRVRFPMLGGQL